MTDPWLSFDPVIHPVWLTIMLMVLAGFFLFLEWKKPARHLILRVVALVLGCVAIAGLLFHPKIRSEKSDSIILLTENFDKTKTDSILNINPTANLYALPGLKPYNDSKIIESIYDLENIIPHIDFIIGDGLSTSTLDILPNINFQHIASGYPEGIIDLRIANPVVVNRPNKIHGSVNFSNENQRIVLEGPGGVEDSCSDR
jgi:hypothetical protein